MVSIVIKLQVIGSASCIKKKVAVLLKNGSITKFITGYFRKFAEVTLNGRRAIIYKNLNYVNF